MKKRSIAFLLSLVMLLSLLTPTALAEEPDQEGPATEESTEIPALSETAVAVPREAAFGDETTVTAPEGAESYQWQFQLMEDLWVNISGDESAEIVLTYAKVCNMLDESGAASLRCLVDGAASETLTVTVTDEPAQEPDEDPVLDEEPVPDEEPVLEEEPVLDEEPVIQPVLPVLDPQQSAEDTIVGGVIGVQADGNVKTTYNIVINYVFAKDGSTAADPYIAQLAEGETFNTTVNFPTVKGYLPYVNDVQQDSYTFAIDSVSEDITVTVVYKPTNVDYKVIHYQQNVGNDEYTVIEEENKQGMTDSPVPEVAKEYEGFYSLLYERPNIAADGSTVIEVYYDRYYYLMTFDLDEGFGTEPIYARYGAKIGTVNEPTKKGYRFEGWSETKDGTTAVTLPTTMPVGNKKYYAIWTADDTAKVTIVFWGENADDEGYSYLHSEEINQVPGTSYTYDGSNTTCPMRAHSHDNCIKACSHTHTLDCYNTSRDFKETSTVPSQITSQNTTNDGVYTYTTSSYRRTTHYYLKLAGKWYTGTDWRGKADDTKSITESCPHVCDDSCYTCGQVAHTHSSACSDMWKFIKSDTITVAADGSSVVNVYYDRKEYSVQFYSRDRGNPEYTDLKITAKWGQNIHDKWPTVNGSPVWYVGPDTSTAQSGIQVMPVGGAKFYGPSSRTGATASYYVEVIAGEAGVTVKNGVTFKLHHTDVASPSATVTDEERYEMKGFTNQASWGTQNGEYYSGAEFYYTRNSYKLTFNNGYENIRTESVKYEAPLGTYASYEPDVPDGAYESGSVTFGGWYLNPECSGEEYKLDEHTMPADNVLLYAKWVPVQHTVRFYLTEDAEAVYTPANAAAASFTVAHGSTLDEAYVNANLTVDAMNEAKPNGDYKFVVWYYYKDGVKKYFDPSMQVREDMTLYGEWSSDTLKEYTVRFVLKDDPDTKVAPDLTGSGLTGTTKTFNAKGGTELFTDYQEGYFPTVKSQSLVLDIENDNLVITFEYVQAEEVPYTVKYINTETGTSVFDGVTVADKYVSDNRKAVVTETFKVISGYMPDAYQKRLVVTVDGENILYFYYTKDDQHAYYKITHYTELSTAADGTTNWTIYRTSEAPGDIGTRYTASPLTIRGYKYVRTEYVSNGVAIPADQITDDGAMLSTGGLEINLYYVRSEYPYQVRYLEKGTNNVLHEPKDAKGKYGEVISESAIEIPNYVALAPTSQTLDIQIEEGEEAKENIITFYYELALADLTISKTFPDGTNTDIDEHQSFIFHVKGLDEQNKNIEMDVVVKLGVNNNSVTIKGLKVGNYQVTEDSGWSWRYEVKSGEANPRTVAVKGGVSNTVTFTNTREMDKWLNGCSWAENNWASGKKKTDKNPNGETN